MTFAAHGALGTGVTLVCLSPLDPDTNAKIVMGVAGFIFGSLPDTADWFAATFLGKTRWTLYGRMHHGDLTWKFWWCPPFLLHVWLDTYIHDPEKPGWNWWPERWYMEIGMWLISGILIWIGSR